MQDGLQAAFVGEVDPVAVPMRRFAGIAASADDALSLFGTKRTHNGKGVTLPR